MRTSIVFGIPMPPPEEVGSFEEEIRKFCSEYPEKIRFASSIQKLKHSISTLDIVKSCYWLIQSSEHSDDSTSMILNCFCEEFVKIFAQFQTKLTNFLIRANHFYKSWEKGCFEDCLTYLERSRRCVTKDSMITSILFGACVDKLVEFKYRSSFVNTEGYVIYHPICPANECINFFAGW